MGRPKALEAAEAIASLTGLRVKLGAFEDKPVVWLCTDRGTMYMMVEEEDPSSGLFHAIDGDDCVVAAARRRDDGAYDVFHQLFDDALDEMES
ncbi:hypothetical protein JJL56_01970 [Azospirillum sp. YIM DDC1]|uniref:Uncharacterized protein n=1 Tax=Azospirillum aestuarii TaxID=2802052 RepID=A0ABS1HSD4_9PROT|nr:hypothetical protein [Azospirillum aestuarii]MBK4717626.1 hypothetical protein [Azospirillum aestuarii]